MRGALTDLQMDTAYALLKAYPQAAKVSCVVAADHLLVCGVSNWGGTAIAAALMLLAHDDENRVLQERQERLPVGQAAEAEAEGGEGGGGGGGGGRPRR